MPSADDVAPTLPVSVAVVSRRATLPVARRYDRLRYIRVAVAATGFIAGLSGVAGKSKLAGRAGA